MNVAQLFSPRKKADSEAARRFAHMRSGNASAVDEADLGNWRAANEMNEEAWQRISGIWNVSAADSGHPSIQAMRTAALQRPAEQRKTRPNDRWRGYALAASLILMIGATAIVSQGGLSSFLGSGSSTSQWADSIQTEVGQIRSVALADGSHVTLNTNSVVRTALAGRERRVELLRGEALFDVARDPARPFSVESGELVVTALGTSFVVRKDPSETLVTLKKGKVRVTSLRSGESRLLEPGFQLQVDANGFHLRRADLSRATGWTSGQLDFRAAPLASAVAEMNRYSDRKIILSDKALATKPISGVFITGDQQRFVDMLVATGQVGVSHRSASEIALKAP